MPRLNFCTGLVLLLNFAFLRLMTAQGQNAEEVVVEADRLPSPETSAPFDVHVLEEDDLRNAPQLRLDDILRQEVPGFSLFRRNSSRTANPTTQGVTLRNFGPSGAGRTLVLLDGIPLNDPFAGYVLWSQVPPTALQSVVVVSGGGGGLFGNEALAGTIFLVSPGLTSDSARVEGSVGNYDTDDASAVAIVTRGPMATSVFAERFTTSGYPVIRGDQRGPVDNTASADSTVFDARAQWQVTSDTSVRLDLREFYDNRGNGTILTRNDTTGVDASAVWTTQFPQQAAELQLSVYGQHRKFRSSFSSINSTRTVETPSLNQFDVPADAVGGSAVWSMAADGGHHLTCGTDFRWVEGETNEAFRWNGVQFTRLRNAGGSEAFAGVFAEDAWSVSPQWTVVGGVRFDHWELFDGSRKETNRLTGALTLNRIFRDRDGNEMNGRLGAQFTPAQDITLRGAAYTGFRGPTLNELYRPFRVGNDVTEANPQLKPEHLMGAEAGVDWQATKTVRLSATGFFNRLEDAIGNVTIGVGPGTFKPGGFIPAGGVLRQRQNLGLVTAPGVELTAMWQLLPSLGLKTSYLFTHPSVEQAADPAAEGKLLAQTPENVVTGALVWTPAAKWTMNLQIRYNDRQFEDDQNLRVLRPFITVNAGVTYEISFRLSAAVKIENALDEQIETGKSADGLVSIGQPRLVTFQVRLQL